MEQSRKGVAGDLVIIPRSSFHSQITYYIVNLNYICLGKQFVYS